MGVLGVVFDIEGMCPVQDDPRFVKEFYDLGVRWMLVAYNRNNLAGGGCMDSDTGLTTTGRSIIDAMEKVGMVLCLSHTGARTARDALEYANNPVIFSHSNPFGDTPHPRNVADDLMRLCAAKGGVIGLSGIGPFLGATLDLTQRLLRQIKYVIDLVGPEHVGLGLDYVFDRQNLEDDVRLNPSLYPPGVTGGLAMIEPEEIPSIADGLTALNLTDEQIRDVLGNNWLRIATRVWR
jgi:membrane dipeptidase